MCGIAGAILLPKSRSREQNTEIQHRITQLLYYMEARGSDGTGLAVVSRDGTVSRYRAPGVSGGYASYDPNYTKVLRGIGYNTSIVIGHTRASTVGNNKDVEDFHPFTCGPIVGCHNGVFTGCDYVTKAHGLNLRGVCDSEVLFALLADKSAGKPVIGEDDIYDSLNELGGMYTVAFTDTRMPNRIFLGVGDNPLAVSYNERLGCLFWASTEDALVLTAHLFSRLYGDYNPEVTWKMGEYTCYVVDSQNIQGKSVLMLTLTEGKDGKKKTKPKDFESLFGVRTFKLPYRYGMWWAGGDEWGDYLTARYGSDYLTGRFAAEDADDGEPVVRTRRATSTTSMLPASSHINRDFHDANVEGLRQSGHRRKKGARG